MRLINEKGVIIKVKKSGNYGMLYFIVMKMVALVDCEKQRSLNLLTIMFIADKFVRLLNSEGAGEYNFPCSLND